MAEEVGGVFRRDAVVGGMRQRGSCHVREPVLSAAGDLAGVMGPAAGGDDDQGRDVQPGELARAQGPGEDDLCAAEVLTGGDHGEPGRVKRASPG